MLRPSFTSLVQAFRRASREL